MHIIHTFTPETSKRDLPNGSHRNDRTCCNRRDIDLKWYLFRRCAIVDELIMGYAPWKGRCGQNERGRMHCTAENTTKWNLFSLVQTYFFSAVVLFLYRFHAFLEPIIWIKNGVEVVVALTTTIIAESTIQGYREGEVIYLYSNCFVQALPFCRKFRFENVFHWEPCRALIDYTHLDDFHLVKTSMQCPDLEIVLTISRFRLTHFFQNIRMPIQIAFFRVKIDWAIMNHCKPHTKKNR